MSLEKIHSRESLHRRVAEWRRAGERVTLTNGVFDVLHVGHVRYLHAAKALGGRLIVAVNADATVRALKGEGRPRMPAAERAELLAALEGVDAVVIFDEPDVRALIREVRPDIHAKGTDYTADTVPEAALDRTLGIEVRICGDDKARSSTDLIQRIRDAAAPAERARPE